MSTPIPAPTPGYDTALQEVLPVLQRGQRFLSTAHSHLDGDALGAMLVTAHGLRALGKQVLLYNQDPVPRRLRFLPGAHEVRRKLPADQPFDATLVHDTGARHLLGDRFPQEAVTGPLLIVDHHLLASDFGAHQVRDPAAASAGVVAWRILHALGLSEDRMERDLATCLLASLVEDTGWFRYPNTNPEALRLAGACVAAGAQPWPLSLSLDDSVTEASLRLLRLVLGTLERHCKGQLALLTLTDDMLREAGASLDDAGKLVNYARSLQGVEVGALLTYGDKGIYVSLRSKGNLDVAAVASRFGGGGHRGAAGCALSVQPTEEARRAARALLVQAVAEALAQAPEPDRAAPQAPRSIDGAP